MTEPGERSEPNARVSNAERLTLAEAAERMNVSTDAVRMRVRRGTLATVLVNGRTFILWPQPERTNERRTRTERRAERRVPVQSEDRLVSALEERITSLERQLTVRDEEIRRHDEEIRRRDHIIAGLIDRVPALPSGETPREHAPQDVILRAPTPVQSSEPLDHGGPPRSSADTLALAWRRWWRRITGGG